VLGGGKRQEIEGENKFPCVTAHILYFSPFWHFSPFVMLVIHSLSLSELKDTKNYSERENGKTESQIPIFALSFIFSASLFPSKKTVKKLRTKWKILFSIE